MLVELDCPWCSGPEPFEVPPCADGHGDRCPERVCTTCSGALVVAEEPRVPALAVPRLAVVA